MDRSMLVITLALVTMFLVMGWAWYSKRRAQSGPHYFGARDGKRDAETNAATEAANDGVRPDKR